MTTFENLPIHKIVEKLTKQNVARLSSTARLLRMYGTERRRSVRKIAGTVKAVSKFRPKKPMTETTQRMVKLVRILSLFPKTSRNGYPLRKRMAAKIFSEPYTVTSFGNIKIGNITSNNFFTFNPSYGGFFRDGQWHTTLFPSGQVHTVKQQSRVS
jgi:hypothetical protein